VAGWGVNEETVEHVYAMYLAVQESQQSGLVENWVPGSAYSL
jgi:hypothetical protein